MGILERYGPAIIAIQFVAVPLEAQFSLGKSPPFPVRIPDNLRVCATMNDALHEKDLIVRIPRIKTRQLLLTAISSA